MSGSSTAISLQEKKKREKEKQVVEDQINTIRKQRDGVNQDANELYFTLHNFADSFEPTSAPEFFMSPEAMERMIQEFEDNTKKGVLALSEINSTLESIGQSATNGDTDNSEMEDIISNAFPVDKMGEDYKRKMTATAAKLTSIFSRSKKNYNDLLQSFSQGVDGDLSAGSEADLEAALIPILQQKVKQLQKDLELSNMKARSLAVQM